MKVGNAIGKAVGDSVVGASDGETIKDQVVGEESRLLVGGLLV